ncbi:Txe/YoeB family addiction module toxin [Tetragenococcus muriaticus]|uniref:Txe/YoeB family addiction module toxin n=1 Tax=Tetragenococcus muriaticus TaxID=64642 RepID=UPI000490B09D|nr:Txe/YoeB family addiction module toxin [Tetragenococcus muriaticus]
MSQSYQVKIHSGAKKDLKKIRQSSLQPSFERIVQTLKEDPYLPTQSFEKLQPKHLDRYSRRINRQHRVVYHVDETTKTVYIYSAWSHYQ